MAFEDKVVVVTLLPLSAHVGTLCIGTVHVVESSPLVAVVVAEHVKESLVECASVVEVEAGSSPNDNVVDDRSSRLILNASPSVVAT